MRVVTVIECAIGGLLKCAKFIRSGHTFQGCWVTVDFDDVSLGKPLYKRSAVQTEIRRKGGGGGGGENPFQMECGSSSVNMNHYLGT